MGFSRCAYVAALMNVYFQLVRPVSPGPHIVAMLRVDSSVVAALAARIGAETMA